MEKQSLMKTNNPPEGMYERLVEAAGDVFFICDAYGTCTYINQVVEKLYGYKPEDILGQHFTLFIHPDWQMKVLEFYLDQFNNRIPQTRLEFPAITRDGEEKWVDQIVILLTDGEWVTGFQGFARDISQRKQQEMDYRSSQLTMRAMVEDTTDLVFAKDHELRYTLFNAAGEAMMGMSSADVLGKTDYDLFGQDVGDTMGKLDREILQTGETRTYDIERVLKGEVRTLSITKYPLIAGDGQLLGVIGMGRDITDRVRAEGSLKALMNNTEDSIYSIDNEMRIVELNRTFREQFYRATNTLLEPGMCPADYIGYKEGTKWRNWYQRALNGESFSEEEYFPTVNVYADMHLSPIRMEDGKIVGAAIFSRNITERILAELARAANLDQVHVLQEVNDELTQDMDFDRVLDLALKAAVNLSGASAGAIHLAEKSGLHVAKVIGDYPPEMENTHIPFNRGIVGRVLQTQKAELTLDVHNDPDYVAGVKASEAQITVPLISRNQVIGTLNVQTEHPETFSEDIFTFIKLLSGRIAVVLDNARQFTELTKLNAQLIELEELKTLLIQLAAHDLKNPLQMLQGVLAGVEMAAKSAPETITDHLREGKVAVKRMNKIITDLLTMERSQNGLVKMPIDLRVTAQESFQSSESEAKSKRIHFKLDVPNQPVSTYGDGVLMREAMHNLMHNAIKYTPDGGEVMVRLALMNDHIRFEVEDNGYGIPKDQIGALFKVFSRILTPETKNIRGSGLGLNLVKTIIEQHRGRVGVESVYKQGSTFWFALPVLTSAEDSTSRRVW